MQRAPVLQDRASQPLFREVQQRLWAETIAKLVLRSSQKTPVLQRGSGKAEASTDSGRMSQRRGRILQMWPTPMLLISVGVKSAVRRGVMNPKVLLLEGGGGRIQSKEMVQGTGKKQELLQYI